MVTSARMLRVVKIWSRSPVFRPKFVGSAKNPDFTISVLPEQDHYFLVFEGHRLKRHNFGKMKVAPVLLDTVTTWLRRPAPST